MNSKLLFSFAAKFKDKAEIMNNMAKAKVETEGKKGLKTKGEKSRL